MSQQLTFSETTADLDKLISKLREMPYENKAVIDMQMKDGTYKAAGNMAETVLTGHSTWAVFAGLGLAGTVGTIFSQFLGGFIGGFGSMIPGFATGGSMLVGGYILQRWVFKTGKAHDFAIGVLIAGLLPIAQSLLGGLMSGMPLLGGGGGMPMIGAAPAAGTPAALPLNTVQR